MILVLFALPSAPLVLPFQPALGQRSAPLAQLLDLQPKVLQLMPQYRLLAQQRKQLAALQHGAGRALRFHQLAQAVRLDGQRILLMAQAFVFSRQLRQLGLAMASRHFAAALQSA
ncbi:hypothetical protein WL29_29960 [Burkholderia ubonensis]|uniref:Uncharacterized protein n=1 Tax=Burkholderia ubonensis TaxID=101571 RepID=A0A106UPJ9_9BURK|nr:hypothetical protein WL16_17645 [Burkholderia ubonensis]KWA80411.1 hypothetical protein WL29_29960 [Burkholderia ubonensis]KWB95254.1 hypothetical protein WL43_32375 [Burkholderia ubonensis]